MSTDWLAAAQTRVGPSDERAVQRRVGLIWALLFLNVLSFSGGPIIIPIPSAAGKLITQGSLAVALLLVLTVNRRLLFRPNIFLLLASVLAIISVLVTVQALSHVGSLVRAARLVGFLSVLWLLTPWWGRRDMMLARYQLRYLVGVLALVLLGAAISPHKAFGFEGRLSGVVWPIPPTQVAHYAAVAAGMAAVLWLSGLLRRNATLVLFVGGVGIVVLTHTRTALVAMSIGVLVAGMSLFTSRRRVRKVFAASLVVALLCALFFLPALTKWFERGQSSQELTALTGRTAVWSALVNEPRSRSQILLGFGLSNKSFNGLPIDNGWLAVYQDQGLVGDVICGLIFFGLLVIAAHRPRGPARALSLFLIVYCLIASFTETGIGDASTYLMDLTVAASLLTPSAYAAAIEGWRQP